MTLVCLDCGSNSIDDTDAPWDAGKIPACPFCGDPLRDNCGVVLDRGADRGWCYSVRRHQRKKPVDYGIDRWDWKDRDVFDYRALLPLGETRELAAHAPTPDAQEDDR